MTKVRTHTPELGQASRARHHYQASVDVHLLLMRDGRVLLGRRSNTGYGDGAYEPPSSRLDERETVVEAAIRVAADDLPANMIDRARVAVRNYAAGIGFSTYPSFLPSVRKRAWPVRKRAWRGTTWHPLPP